MTELQDQELRDEELLEEITLTSDLMVLAAETAGPLAQDRIDAVLGVRR